MAELKITVNGRPHSAAPGANLAVALLNWGYTQFRESVSGEARGPICGMGICHECRVRLNGVEHVRACLVSLNADAEVQLG